MVPQDLQELCNSFNAKCKAGTAHVHGSGFGGSGFKFDAGEEESQRAQRQVRCPHPSHTVELLFPGRLLSPCLFQSRTPLSLLVLASCLASPPTYTP